MMLVHLLSLQQSLLLVVASGPVLTSANITFNAVFIFSAVALLSMSVAVFFLAIFVLSVVLFGTDSFVVGGSFC